MYFPNPREHPWFSDYHWFRMFEAGLLIAAAVMYAEKIFSRWIIAGAIILGWETFELGYLIARLGQANAHENLLGLISIDGTGAVFALHNARMLLCIIFLYLEFRKEGKLL